LFFPVKKVLETKTSVVIRTSPNDHPYQQGKSNAQKGNPELTYKSGRFVYKKMSQTLPNYTKEGNSRDKEGEDSRDIDRGEY
jgi:hypothetical protein